MFYFHNLFLLDDDIVQELLEQLCDLLRDPKVRRFSIRLLHSLTPLSEQIEVREAAAATLSGIVRCSQRSAILTLSNRFMTVIRSAKIPKRRNAAGGEVEGYQEALAVARASASLSAHRRRS